MKKLVATLALLSLFPLAEVSAQEQPEISGRWITGEAQDAFGDPSGIVLTVFRGYLEGRYSNSAVSNRTLFAKVRFDHNGTASFVLYEGQPGTSNLKRRYSDEAYIATIRDGQGTDHTFTGYSFDTRIGFPGGNESAQGESIADLFMRGESLRILIRGRDREVEHYYLTLSKEDLEGFSDAIAGTGYQP